MIEVIFWAFAIYGLGVATGYVAGLLATKKIPKDEGGETDG